MPSTSIPTDLQTSRLITSPGLLILASTMAVLCIGIAAYQSPKLGLLAFIGLLMGLTLYHAAFGFASAYRRLFVSGEINGILGQLLMLALATCLFAPVLVAGNFMGNSVSGAVAPFGWQVAIGALMFGLGMQLGGGCGSGTLFTIGAGSPRMLITLCGFVAGSFWASLHMTWWASLPKLGALSLASLLGWPVALGVQLAAFVLIAWSLRRWGNLIPAKSRTAHFQWRRLLSGPWSFVAGAVILAALNFLTLIIAGHPWTITWAFTLWGAKLAQSLGWEPSSSLFWLGGFQQRALRQTIFADTTSVMNIAIMIGAFAAASCGRLLPRSLLPARTLVAAVVGGVAMGYGARIAFGCNIGAFFSGIASTSLHGWLWIIAALIGTWLGVKLRPWFGLSN